MAAQKSTTISGYDALQSLPEERKERLVSLWEHGTLEVKLYAPRAVDLQAPHTRDEIYVVLRGRGEFLTNDERRTVGPGDFIFVEAGVEHQFENFSDGLALWVFFFGPEGGEE
jgi:mannose-6-phosphate isomerase-like protein (cupin superfamily)